MVNPRQVQEDLAFRLPRTFRRQHPLGPLLRLRLRRLAANQLRRRRLLQPSPNVLRSDFSRCVLLSEEGAMLPQLRPLRPDRLNPHLRNPHRLSRLRLRPLPRQRRVPLPCRHRALRPPRDQGFLRVRWAYPRGLCRLPRLRVQRRRCSLRIRVHDRRNREIHRRARPSPLRLLLLRGLRNRPRPRSLFRERLLRHLA